MAKSQQMTSAEFAESQRAARVAQKEKAEEAKQELAAPPKKPEPRPDWYQIDPEDPFRVSVAIQGHRGKVILADPPMANVYKRDEEMAARVEDPAWADATYLKLYYQGGGDAWPRRDAPDATWVSFVHSLRRGQHLRLERAIRWLTAGDPTEGNS